MNANVIDRKVKRTCYNQLCAIEVHLHFTIILNLHYAKKVTFISFTGYINTFWCENFFPWRRSRKLLPGYIVCRAALLNELYNSVYFQKPVSKPFVHNDFYTAIDRN